MRRLHLVSLIILLPIAMCAVPVLSKAQTLEFWVATQVKTQGALAREYLGSTVYLLKQLPLSQVDITQAILLPKAKDYPFPIMKLELTPAASKRLNDASVSMVGEALAFVVHGEVISYMAINRPLAGRTYLLLLNMSEEQLQPLINAITAAAKTGNHSA